MKAQNQCYYCYQLLDRCIVWLSSVCCMLATINGAHLNALTLNLTAPKNDHIKFVKIESESAPEVYKHQEQDLKLVLQK